MNRKIARPLDSQPEVATFLTHALQIDTSRLKMKVMADIIVCEKGVMDGVTHPTVSFVNYRSRAYANDADRVKLRHRIVEELFTKKRLANDDKVTLGKGGAMPLVTKQKRQAFVLIGLPASGKSGVAMMIADKFGGILLDSDLAKRKLPEYAIYPWGASLVNSESTLITFGDDSAGFVSLFERALAQELNVVIPKIGAEPEEILALCNILKAARYTVHLTLVDLPREKSAKRALQRFITSNRYVPLAKIFDEYANNPALTYFRLKNAQPTCVDTYGIVNTDVMPGAPCICMDVQGNNPSRLYKKAKTS